MEVKKYKMARSWLTDPDSGNSAGQWKNFVQQRKQEWKAREGFKGAGLVDQGPVGVRQGYAENDIDKTKKIEQTKARKVKFFKTEAGEQLKWIADNGKNYSSSEIMEKDFKKKFKVKNLKNSALFESASFSQVSGTYNLQLNLLKGEKYNIVGTQFQVTPTQATNAFNYKSGNQIELFKASILQNNERVKNTISKTFSNMSKDFDILKKESRLLGVNDALETLNKKEYRILRDFGFIDQGIGGGIVRKTLKEQGITKEQLYHFDNIRNPILHTTNIIKSLEFASSRKQYGLNAADANKIIKGWKRVSLGFDDANYWIKGVDKFLGDNKFKQIFGKTTFDHVLAKELGKGYYKLNLPKDLLLKGKYTTASFNNLKMRLYDKPLINLVEKYNNATGADKKKIAQQIDNLHKEFNVRTNNYLKGFEPDFTKGKTFTFSEKPFSDIGKYERTGAAAKEIRTGALGMLDLGEAAGKYDYSKGQTKVIKDFRKKQDKFANLLTKNLDKLDSPTLTLLGKRHGCLGLQGGGSLLSCLKGKLNQDPQTFLQNTGRLAVATKSPGLLKWIKVGRTVLRGTGLFALWEAAFAPIIAGMMIPAGESGKRITHDIFYGSLLEAMGVPPEYVPGEGEEEELQRYFGNDPNVFAVHKLAEIGGEGTGEERIPGELDYLYEDLDRVIEESAATSKAIGKEWKSPKQLQIEELIKEKEQEYSKYTNTPDFYQGPAGGATLPAGQEYNQEVINKAFAKRDEGLLKLEADREANKEWYREHKLLAGAGKGELLDIGRFRKAGGGMTGIRRPDAVPPVSGPDPQGEGLSYLLNRVKKQ